MTEPERARKELGEPADEDAARVIERAAADERREHAEAVDPDQPRRVQPRHSQQPRHARR